MQYILFTVTLILASINLVAQQNVVCGVYWNPSSLMEYFAVLDLSNGAITPVNSLPGVTGVSGGTSTFDHVNNLFIIRTPQGIITVDANTGGVVDTFASAYDILELEFDSATNATYGMYWNSTDSSEYIATLDMTSGAIFPINNLPGVTTIAEGTSTFDHSNGLYIIKCNLGIIAVSTNTGIIVDTFNTIYNFCEYEFDTSLNRMYGVYWDTTNGVEFFAYLDMDSGTIIPVNSLPGVTGVFSGSSTFDHVNGLYVINTPQGIIAVDVSTGIVVDTFATLYNFAEFEFNPDYVPGLNDIHDLGSVSTPILLYPNPADHQVVLSCSSPIQGVTIYNNQGQELSKNEHQNTERVWLDTRHLPTGLYTLLVQTDAAFMFEKLIIDR